MRKGSLLIALWSVAVRCTALDCKGFALSSSTCYVRLGLPAGRYTCTSGSTNRRRCVTSVEPRVAGAVSHEQEVEEARTPSKSVHSKVEDLRASFEVALERRQPLMQRLVGERTNCYRLFHGAVEGCPGLTIDRYAEVMLVQTFRDPPSAFAAATVDELCGLATAAVNLAEEAASAETREGDSSLPTAVTLLPVWNDRRKRRRRRKPPEGGGIGGGARAAREWPAGKEDLRESRDDGNRADRTILDSAAAFEELASESGGAQLDRHKLSTVHEPSPAALGVKVGIENGVLYPLAVRHWGNDPWLFLDLRAARKWILRNSKGLEVLNLFSYTGGVAAAATCGGAASVWNVDFARSAHEVGRANLKLNAGSAGKCDCQWLQMDVLPTIRQLAGIPTNDYRRSNRGARGRAGGFRSKRGGRGRGAGEARRTEVKLKPKQFDTVFLDPPTWSTSSHGAVDLVRDYQSLFKPSLLATKEGGAIVATNHVSTVDCGEWVESLSRCAAKVGRTVTSVELLPPEEDFPSPDGRHPLKIAIFRV